MKRKLITLWLAVSLICGSIMYISEVFARELIPLDPSAKVQDWLDAPERIKRDTCKILSIGSGINENLIYKTMDAFYKEYSEVDVTIIQLMKYIMTYVEPGMYLDENGKLRYIYLPLPDKYNDSFLYFPIEPKIKKIRFTN